MKHNNTATAEFIMSPFLVTGERGNRTDEEFWKKAIKRVFSPQRSSTSRTENFLLPPHQQSLDVAEITQYESTETATSQANILDGNILALEIEARFRMYSEDQFEDGIESTFVSEIYTYILRYGNKAVEAIAGIIASGRTSPIVVSEALRWLGKMPHPESHRARLFLLERSLHDSSRWVRDGAALGLASLKDTHAIPYLREAVANEQVQDLRDDMQTILQRLEKLQ